MNNVVKIRIKKPGWHRVYAALIMYRLVPLVFFSHAQANMTVCETGCDYSSIFSAINAAKPADTIVVKSGVYPETLFIQKNITVKSESGPQNTIIEPGFGGAPFIRISAGELKGFTIRNGRNFGSGLMDISTCMYGSGTQTGALIASATATVRNNIFTNNNGLCGGAINIQTDYSTNNNVTIQNNIFRNNEAWFGGAVFVGAGYSTIKLVNNLMYANTGTQTGGAIYVLDNTYNSIFIVNNTISKNTALGNSAAGIYAGNYSYVKTYNSIIAGNNGTDIFWEKYGTQFYNSIIGTGAINNSDALHNIVVSTEEIKTIFSNFNDNDFSLRSDSIAIDKGTSNTGDYVTMIDDMIGTPRPQDGDGEGVKFDSDIDIGAYEYFKKLDVNIDIGEYVVCLPYAVKTAGITITSGTEPITQQVIQIISGNTIRVWRLDDDLCALEDGDYILHIALYTANKNQSSFAVDYPFSLSHAVPTFEFKNICEECQYVLRDYQALNVEFVITNWPISTKGIKWYTNNNIGRTHINTGGSIAIPASELIDNQTNTITVLLDGFETYTIKLNIDIISFYLKLIEPRPNRLYAQASDSRIVFSINDYEHITKESPLWIAYSLDGVKLVTVPLENTNFTRGIGVISVDTRSESTDPLPFTLKLYTTNWEKSTEIIPINYKRQP